MVGKDELHIYQDMSAEGRQRHGSWVGRNIILGSIFAGGLLVMAAVGSTMALKAPDNTASDNSRISELSASEKAGPPPGPTLLELMSTAPHNLPVRPEDESAF